MSLPHSLQHTATEYLQSLATTYSPQTITAYTQALRLFIVILRKHFSIDATKEPSLYASADWMIAYLHHLQHVHSIETEHLYSRAILGFYQYLEQNEPSALFGLTHNITLILTTNRRPKQVVMPDLPLDAIHAILAHVVAAATFPPKTDADTDRETLRMLRDKALLLTLADTGLRVSEVCALRLAHLNPTQHTLALDPDFSLSLPPTTLTALTHYLAARNSLDKAQRLVNPSHLPLFARHDKKAAHRVLSISRWTAANIVHNWANAALSPQMRNHLALTKRTITPHTFRHYFIVTTLQATSDLQATSTLARHTNLNTTKRYLRYLPKIDDKH